MRRTPPKITRGGRWLIEQPIREQTYDGTLIQDLARSQVLLVDHLRLTIAYGRYLSFFYVTLFAGWLVYTLIVCVWMAQVRNRAVKTEFVVVEMVVSFLVVVCFVSSNIVHSKNKYLYKLATSLMAMDSAESPTKARWITIVKLYFPRPLYCITVVGYFQISWLFSMKVCSNNIEK